MRTVALLALALCLAAAPSALAHADAISSSPAGNERLTDAPVQVAVQFSEPFDAQGSWLRVQDADGNRVDLDDLTASMVPEPSMQISLGPIENGSYLALWQTFSPSDGHTVRGAIGFSVGPHEPPATEGLGSDVSLFGVLSRVLIYAGAMGAIGLLAFLWFVVRQPIEGSMEIDRSLLVAAMLTSAGAAGLLIDALAATGIAGMSFLATQAGRGLFVRLAVALAVLIVTILWLYGPVQPRVRYQALAGLWVVSLLAGAQFGHTDGPAAMVVQAVHGVSMAVWLGGLIAFLAWLKMRAPSAVEVAAMGSRFGTTALIAAILLVVTGVLMSVGILGAEVAKAPFAYPWRTVLTLKINLALLMLGVAAVNRYVVLGNAPWAGRARAAVARVVRLTPTDESGMLRRLIVLEVGLGLLAMTLAGALMSLSPAV